MTFFIFLRLNFVLSTSVLQHKKNLLSMEFYLQSMSFNEVKVDSNIRIYVKHTFLNCRIFWLLETGIFSKHYKHWIMKKPKCSYSSTFSSVGVEYLAGMFSILILMHLFSFGLMICENIHFYYNKINYQSQ